MQTPLERLIGRAGVAGDRRGIGQRWRADATIAKKKSRGEGLPRPRDRFSRAALFQSYGTETLVASPELVMVKVPEVVEA